MIITDYRLVPLKLEPSDKDRRNENVPQNIQLHALQSNQNTFKGKLPDNNNVSSFQDVVQISSSYNQFVTFKDNVSVVNKSLGFTGTTAQALTETFSDASDLTNATNQLSTACGNIGSALTFSFAGMEIQSALKDETLSDKEKKAKVGEVVGGLTASVVAGGVGFKYGLAGGNSVGGAIGGVLGSIVGSPEAGAVIGSKVGGFLGSILGAYTVSHYTSKAGKWVGKKIGSMF